MEGVVEMSPKYLNEIRLSKLPTVILFSKEEINAIKKYLSNYLMYLSLRNHIHLKFH